jgi:hypothetical protein
MFTEPKEDHCVELRQHGEKVTSYEGRGGARDQVMEMRKMNCRCKGKNAPNAKP